MNLAAVIDDEIHTPRLSGSILPGVTRDSLLELARYGGMTVVERDIPIDDLLADVAAGRCSEFFACGTAAIVCPIAAILDIQEGRAEDPFGWAVEAADLETLISRMAPE